MLSSVQVYQIKNKGNCSDYNWIVSFSFFLRVHLIEKSFGDERFIDRIVIAGRAKELGRNPSEDDVIRSPGSRVWSPARSILFSCWSDQWSPVAITINVQAMNHS